MGNRSRRTPTATPQSRGRTSPTCFRLKASRLRAIIRPQPTTLRTTKNCTRECGLLSATYRVRIAGDSPRRSSMFASFPHPWQKKMCCHLRLRMNTYRPHRGGVFVTRSAATNCTSFLMGYSCSVIVLSEAGITLLYSGIRKNWGLVCVWRSLLPSKAGKAAEYSTVTVKRMKQRHGDNKPIGATTAA